MNSFRVSLGFGMPLRYRRFDGCEGTAHRGAPWTKAATQGRLERARVPGGSNGRLTPNDFESTDHVRQRILGFFTERNRWAHPIQWTYTAQKLLATVRRQRRLAAAG